MDRSPLTEDSRVTSPQVDDATLRSQLLAGVMWTGGVRWLAQLISWPIMIVIAHVLSPADFGFVALVTVWTRLIMLLTEGGVGSAIVFGPVLTGRQLQQLNLLAVLISAAAFMVAVGLSFPIANFYHSHDLSWVMIGVASTFILEGGMLIPTAMMRREMRFRELALADAARAISDSLVTLAIALLGGRYWALVGGYAAGVLTAAAINIYRCPTGFVFPRWRDLRETLKYAFHLLTASLTTFHYTTADMLIGGRILSPAAIGAYSFAGTIAYAPGDKLVAALTRVTPSVFGMLGKDAEGMWKYVKRITRVLAVGVFPILGGIAATASTLVSVMLGPQWKGAVVPLQILCIHTALTAVTGIVPQALQAGGRARIVAENGVIALFLYPPAFYLLGKLWGTPGLALAWSLITPVLIARLVIHLCHTVGVHAVEYIRLVLPALLATLIMFITVMQLASWLEKKQLPAVGSLGMQVFAGMVAYLLAIATLDRDTLTELLSSLFAAVRNRRVPA